MGCRRPLAADGVARTSLLMPPCETQGRNKGRGRGEGRGGARRGGETCTTGGWLTQKRRGGSLRGPTALTELRRPGPRARRGGAWASLHQPCIHLADSSGSSGGLLCSAPRNPGLRLGRMSRCGSGVSEIHSRPRSPLGCQHGSRKVEARSEPELSTLVLGPSSGPPAGRGPTTRGHKLANIDRDRCGVGRLRSHPCNPVPHLEPNSRTLAKHRPHSAGVRFGRDPRTWSISTGLILDNNASVATHYADARKHKLAARGSPIEPCSSATTTTTTHPGRYEERGRVDLPDAHEFWRRGARQSSKSSWTSLKWHFLWIFTRISVSEALSVLTSKLPQYCTWIGANPRSSR